MQMSEMSLLSRLRLRVVITLRNTSHPKKLEE